MAIAALTPRVRTIVICNTVSASLPEDDVFSLDGVRHNIRAPSLPCHVPLELFLLLSSARKGTYLGKVFVMNERTERLVRYGRFDAVFHEDNALLPTSVDLGNCVFREPGRYTFEVYFTVRGGDGDILKGEHPFTVLADED